MSDPREHLHPAQRPAEPDHPMILEGGVVPGDTRYMAQCLLEEMLQAGLDRDDLLEMSRDPNYQALHAARVTLGDDPFELILQGAAARCGFLRVKTVGQPPLCSMMEPFNTINQGSNPEGGANA